ncbi:hypothetical protein [Barnesiella intestinihominis]|uniref:hypothetical protein n=2 Tax=Barnesiella intestinihominis TaxID=487174 RepID=UPI00189C0BA3|nr:hypothetical protein [Barnesiella intestinihominis]MDB0676045.1 hypothetical protein [Barnesiella intestinihominis]
MGIRMTTKLSEVNDMLMREAERVERLTIRALSKLGEQCVTKIRDRAGDKSWYDQTGNLRSSVGYVIAHNKNIIQYSTFNQVKQGSEGVKTGKDLAEELAKRYSNNYVLIVVAGMNYAEFVEAMDNKDVLASTELWAREQVPLMLEKLKRQIAK